MQSFYHFISLDHHENGCTLWLQPTCVNSKWIVALRKGAGSTVESGRHVCRTALRVRAQNLNSTLAECNFLTHLPGFTPATSALSPMTKSIMLGSVRTLNCLLVWMCERVFVHMARWMDGWVKMYTLVFKRQHGWYSMCKQNTSRKVKRTPLELQTEERQSIDLDEATKESAASNVPKSKVTCMFGTSRVLPAVVVLQLFSVALVHFSHQNEFLQATQFSHRWVTCAHQKGSISFLWTRCKCFGISI